MKTINSRETFLYTYCVKKANTKKVIKLLEENKFHPEYVVTPYLGFVKFQTPCTIKRAELLRQLLKNLMYD